MTSSRTFGRRGPFGIPRQAVAEPGNLHPPGTRPPEATTLAQPATRSGPSVDDELRAWRQERHRQHAYRIPWRPLLLVASLSFFIASFVLPPSVNSTVDWLLDLLAAASSLAWFSGRRKPCRNVADDSPGLPEEP